MPQNPSTRSIGFLGLSLLVVLIVVAMLFRSFSPSSASAAMLNTGSATWSAATPTEDSVVLSRRPMIEVVVADAAHFDTTQASDFVLKINGTSVDASLTPVAGNTGSLTIAYAPLADLPTGVNSVDISVRNRASTVSTAQWNFTVADQNTSVSDPTVSGITISSAELSSNFIESYFDTGDAKFQYRLAGTTPWTDLTTSKTVEATDAPPAQYSGTFTASATGLSEDTTYEVRILPQDSSVPSGVSPSSPAIVKFTTASRITMGTPSVSVGANFVDLKWPFSGDRNGNAVVTYAYRRIFDSAYSAEFPMQRDSGKRVYDASVLDLIPGAEYIVRFTATDPDAESTQTQTLTFSTFPEFNVLCPTTISYYALSRDPAHNISAVGLTTRTLTSPVGDTYYWLKSNRPDGAVTSSLERPISFQIQPNLSQRSDITVSYSWDFRLLNYINVFTPPGAGNIAMGQEKTDIQPSEYSSYWNVSSPSTQTMDSSNPGFIGPYSAESGTPLTLSFLRPGRYDYLILFRDIVIHYNNHEPDQAIPEQSVLVKAIIVEPNTFQSQRSLPDVTIP